ncbi:MAG: pyruvate formate-lyase [Chitinivibrionales bacterium]|nr:pyruvate formate-lyase [Chitinivibrionales bacterium]
MSSMKKHLDTALSVTETYQRYRTAHSAVREAMCLRAMFPAYFLDIRKGDLFAGRTPAWERRMAVGCGRPENEGFAYFCHEDIVRSAIESEGFEPAYRRRLECMLDYWRDETTKAKFAAALPEEYTKNEALGVGNCTIRLSGTLPDYGKLVTLGIPGLVKQVRAHKKAASQRGGNAQFYEGLLMALELLEDVCGHYCAEARRLAAETTDSGFREELTEMAQVLDAIVAAPPGTLREAIQLFWLYVEVSGIPNYGRMDTFFGDFLAADLESGILTESSALRLLQALWRLICQRSIPFNSRIVVGGRGRSNVENADRFALLAMEATRTVVETEPQLTLRFHSGMNPALMQTALDVVGEGRPYPILYNDDVNVEAVMNAFGVCRELAEQYYPFGCGEYTLDHTSLGSPNSVIEPLKAVEAVLFNGRDATGARPLGIATGDSDAFTSFDQVFDAYKKQVDSFLDLLTWHHAIEYEFEARECSFLYASLLYDDCVARGKSIVDGGCRVRGATHESFGLVNAADSLTAIKTLVFDRKLLTLERMKAALAADFEGYEAERRLMLDAPKFGNDDAEADGMMQRVSDHACTYLMSIAGKYGLDYNLMVNINNHGNVDKGRATNASADGRRAGEPLANGNTPTAGRDRNGITALLNSLAKINPTVHAGYVHNLKFGKTMFAKDRTKFTMILNTYFAKGGTQAMITVVDRGELEKAMQRPEEYQNLIVRVGGFSARFVELPADVQRDIMNRTLY